MAHHEQNECRKNAKKFYITAKKKKSDIQWGD
jgi:hypothetical protein